jgi:methyltransferase (TIGR00027 family)
MVEPEPLRGVGKTALGVALIRAHESSRPDRLFDDPYAQAFADAAPDAFPEAAAPAREPVSGVGAAFAFHVVVRTRFFDDYLLRSCTQGLRQVVLLAAGLDTRAYRLAWPAGVRLFELDLPEVLAFKERVLRERGATARCDRSPVPVDLRSDWSGALRAAGLEPGAATAWLVEGLLIYLSAAEAEALLTGVTRLSAPGSTVAFEQGSALHPTIQPQAGATPAMRPYAALWKGGLGQDAADWLTRRGWQVRRHDRTALGRAYGRSAPAISGGALITATRRAGAPS